MRCRDARWLGNGALRVVVFLKNGLAISFERTVPRLMSDLDEQCVLTEALRPRVTHWGNADSPPSTAIFGRCPETPLHEVCDSAFVTTAYRGRIDIVQNG